MTLTEYTELASRTDDGRSFQRLADRLVNHSLGAENLGTLIMSAFGLAGEVGEVEDLIKKFLFHGHDLDFDDLINELGDVAWYYVTICSAIGVNPEEILERNIAKLKKRYPDGFSESASVNRNE